MTFSRWRADDVRSMPPEAAPPAGQALVPTRPWVQTRFLDAPTASTALTAPAPPPCRLTSKDDLGRLKVAAMRLLHRSCRKPAKTKDGNPKGLRRAHVEAEFASGESLKRRAGSADPASRCTTDSRSSTSPASFIPPVTLTQLPSVPGMDPRNREPMPHRPPGTGKSHILIAAVEARTPCPLPHRRNRVDNHLLRTGRQLRRQHR